MIVVERTFAVAAAPEAVTDYFRDLGHTQEWDPAAQQITRNDAGPLVPGASWLQVYKIFGITTELTRTLVREEPGRLVFHGGNEGATRTDIIDVRPAGSGSEVTYRVEAEMHGLAKLATPLLKIEFEKLGTASAAPLSTALDRLAPGLTTEVTFPALPAAPQPREAQA
jgi:carbon monoxide dehydrogenase subunit G